MLKHKKAQRRQRLSSASKQQISRRDRIMRDIKLGIKVSDEDYEYAMTGLIIVHCPKEEKLP